MKTIEIFLKQIDLNELKKSPWEFAHEICSYWKGQSNFWMVAFIKLLNGDIDNETIETAKRCVHKSRYESILEYNADFCTLRNKIQKQALDIEVMREALLLSEQVEKTNWSMAGQKEKRKAIKGFQRKRVKALEQTGESHNDHNNT